MMSLMETTTQPDAARLVVADATHIAVLDPSSVEAVNLLYNSAPVSASGLTWQWQHIASRSMRHELKFTTVRSDSDGDTQALRIGLADDLVVLETPKLPWYQYDGAMRAAAWTVAHESFIELLCAVCGVDWNLNCVDTPSTVSMQSEVECAVGFSVGCDNEHANDVRGIAYLPHALCRELHTRCEPGLPNPIWRRCSAYARCVIDMVTIDASELATLERNSIVLIDNRTLASIQPRVLLTVGEHRWLAEVDDTKLNILARSDRSLENPSTTCEDTIMESQTEADNTASSPCNTADGAYDAEPVDITSVPITLRFEAGRLALPFERLQSIRPGFVFELDQPLDQQSITIYANDKAVASGELVLVGDSIGVRLTSGRPAVPALA